MKKIPKWEGVCLRCLGNNKDDYSITLILKPHKEKRISLINTCAKILNKILAKKKNSSIFKKLYTVIKWDLAQEQFNIKEKINTIYHINK